MTITMADILKEYFASKEKLSALIAKAEDYEQRMIDDGYSPNEDRLNNNIIDLLESIRTTVIESLNDLGEDDCMMIESLLHIDACVSNIRVKLGLPPCSFSKPV